MSNARARINPIQAIGQDEMLIRVNNTKLRKTTKGELEEFQAFWLPLNQLKTACMKYIQAKALDYDVKLI
ncbi:MAG: hypothetical protein ACFFFD_04620 [Promethearchaeota archaeon]